MASILAVLSLVLTPALISLSASSSFLEVLVEECAIALAESEYNWNLIWKAVGTRELHEAATGKSAIMTENAVTDFFKKVKDFFVKLFKKITAFFKNWLDNALVVFRTNDSFVKKYASKLEYFPAMTFSISLQIETALLKCFLTASNVFLRFFYSFFYVSEISESWNCSGS